MRTIKWQTKGSKKQLVEKQVDKDELGPIYKKVLDFPIYDCRVKVDDKNKVIFFIDCTCTDFCGKYQPKKTIEKICGKNGFLCENCKNKAEGCNKTIKIEIEAKWYGGKRVIKHGNLADEKFYSIPCKHLRPVVEALEKQGYILKKPKEMTGEPVLRAALRRKLLERAGNCCEQMKLNEEGVFEKCCSTNNLQVHRKIRGSAGGKYNEENCIVLCWDCHRGPNGVHSNEFRGCQGK